MSHAAAVSTEVAAAAALAPAMAAVTLAAAVAAVAPRARCRSALRATGPAAEPHSSGQSYSMHARPWVMGCNRTWFVLRRGSSQAKAASSSHSSVKIRSGLCKPFFDGSSSIHVQTTLRLVFIELTLQNCIDDCPGPRMSIPLWVQRAFDKGLPHWTSSASAMTLASDAANRPFSS